MEINQLADMDVTRLSTSTCSQKVQNEVQVSLLKKSMEIEKVIAAKLLQSLDIGQHIDLVV